MAGAVEGAELTQPDAHLNHLRNALQDADTAKDFGPWRLTAQRAVGGLSAVGFDEVSDVMLVTSANGQSVLDPFTDELLYRNRAADGWSGPMHARRLDDPAAAPFLMAGHHGGGLLTGAPDGWTIARFAVHLAETCFVVHPPGASIHFLAPAFRQFDKDASFHLIAREADHVAFGFSWTGRALALAMSSDLWVWTRA